MNFIYFVLLLGILLSSTSLFVKETPPGSVSNVWSARYISVDQNSTVANKHQRSAPTVAQRAVAKQNFLIGYSTPGIDPLAVVFSTGQEGFLTFGDGTSGSITLADVSCTSSMPSSCTANLIHAYRNPGTYDARLLDFATKDVIASTSVTVPSAISPPGVLRANAPGDVVR